MKNIIAASTSTLYGDSYLNYLTPTLQDHFQGTEEILFIPYARPGGITHEEYTEKASSFFRSIGKELKGIHTFPDPIKAISEAKGIFTGGGNTFVLVDQLHRLQAMEPLRQALLNGCPYLGTSAGSNLCGPSMQTTNDMPIVHPSSFKTLGVLPYNINAHYMDPVSDSTHMGESRATRIAEFHTLNTIPVIGLREGSWLKVQGDIITLEGKLSALLFEQGKEPRSIPSGTIL
jgi:dipeptidase E